MRANFVERRYCEVRSAPSPWSRGLNLGGAIIHPREVLSESCVRHAAKKGSRAVLFHPSRPGEEFSIAQRSNKHYASLGLVQLLLVPTVVVVGTTPLRRLQERVNASPVEEPLVAFFSSLF